MEGFLVDRLFFSPMSSLRSNNSMSLFSMYKNYKSINNEVVEEVLSGNLCRCTGYDKIVKAVLEVADDMKESA